MLKVLSLFDGIGGAAQALQELNISCIYYASEVDKYSIQIAKKNHPNIKQIGDVNLIDFNQFKNIDLLVAGFPCQDLSIAKRDGKGLDGERSGLFSKCLEALKICKPKYFLFENVNSMKKEWRDRISELLGVQPIMICSSKLTAQMRKRLYWTNIPNIQQPEDKGILLKDIIENGNTEKFKSYCINATYSRACPEDYFNHGQRQLIFITGIEKRDWVGDGKKLSRNYPQGNRIYSYQGKSTTLSASSGGIGGKTGLYEIKDIVRKLTPIECERLQGFPEIQKNIEIKIVGNYTVDLNLNQIFRCLENQKRGAYVEKLNHKSQKPVSHVEKEESKLFARSALGNLHINYPQTKELAVTSVLINLEDKNLAQLNLKKSLLIADSAEKKNYFLLQILIENSARQLADILTIVEREALHGKVELQANIKNSLVQENGKWFVEVSGREIEQFVRDVEKNIIPLKDNMSVTTLQAMLNSKDCDYLSKILCFFVMIVTNLSTQEEMLAKNLPGLNLAISRGYTEGVSQTQRYKTLGNSFTVPVIKHILKGVK